MDEYHCHLQRRLQECKEKLNHLKLIFLTFVIMLKIKINILSNFYS